VLWSSLHFAGWLYITCDETFGTGSGRLATSESCSYCEAASVCISGEYGVIGQVRPFKGFVVCVSQYICWNRHSTCLTEQALAERLIMCSILSIHSINHVYALPPILDNKLALVDSNRMTSLYSQYSIEN
jgi:hypothetical protein